MRIARKLRIAHTLKPILRKLRSVLISVDMAALSVSSCVSASRESLIDDAKAWVAHPFCGLDQRDPCPSNLGRVSKLQEADQQHYNKD